MTSRIPRAQPFAHLLGLSRTPKAAPAPASAPRAATPKPRATPTKPTPKIRASDFNHLFVGHPPPPAPEPAPRKRSVAPAGAAQTALPAVRTEAEERDSAAQIIAAGRKRRAES